MDGLTDMGYSDRTKRLRFSSVILIMLLMMPLPLTQSIEGSAALTTTPEIGVHLRDMISSSESNELMPVLVQFEQGFDYADRVHLFKNLQEPEMVVRNVFKTIPVVSLYADSDAVEMLSRLEAVIALDIDPVRSIGQPRGDFQSAQSTGTGYTHPDGILGADDLWEQGYNGTGTKVAIIDSGVMSDHPDLEGKIVGFYDLIDEEHDMDPSDGIDAYDDNGHGTACAWLVSGTGDGNGGDYKGMAPGADLLIVKALDSTGSGDDSVIAEGIEFAVEQDADVISLSLGGAWNDDQFIIEPSILAVREAVDAGVVVTIAAGNSGPAPITITSPAVVDEAIAVGSSSGDTGIISFSSRGPVYRPFSEPGGYYAKPDLVAPGDQIISALSDQANPAEYPRYNSTQWPAAYTIWSGTSASCPQIAGLAALLIDKHPGITALEIKAFLMAGSTDLNSDPMTEGYGIANVTKASEMIEASSGQITLMTPNEYPTLPGTSSVFIIGEERRGQNVTVISTTNQGTLEITTSGNASQFVVTYDDSVSVGVGYSYFGINLFVPEDLHLSAIGHYIGQLNLQNSEEEIVTSLELDLTITTYGGSIMVDMAHHSAQDPDDVSYYRYFRKYLRDLGMVFSEYPENWAETSNMPTITSNALSTTEVLMIMDTELQYSAAEINAIHEYVDSGGILLILSEGYDTQNGGPAFAQTSYNQILAPYGIQCENNWIGQGDDIFVGEVYGEDYGGISEDHPLTDGVENLYILNGGTFSVDSSVAGAEGLFWTDSDRTHAIVAYATPGKGKVIAVSDGSILYDSISYDAIRTGSDNLVLLRNIAGQVLTEAPRIFDVKLTEAELGESSEVIAYIFDEDLKSVEIKITTPSGQNITKAPVEQLGYKFVTEFTLETAGFYDILVRMEDDSGNVRIFSKTILVQVDTVDPATTQMVVIALLGVVAVGIAIVAIIKFGIGKRARSKMESEWEPRWEEHDEKEGPSIQ
ncbi:hypothetical protein EU537_11380 [Candidatus Thorarchaeota archaeon]|nr:MAG: hypothetical protein EU537_11380 [Candidatus Thorarchaeota archaeon]